MKKIISVVVLVFSIAYCSSQNCNKLPTQFLSYKQAITAIRAAEFTLKDKLPSGKSSWIVSANYYSCDGQNGYMVYSTDKGKEYIHEKLPATVWKAFKNATSSGSYYVQNIKGKYRLIPY